LVMRYILAKVFNIIKSRGKFKNQKTKTEKQF